MKPFEFSLQTDVDKHSGKLLAMYFQIRKGKAAKVVELADGNAFVNYSARGELLGIELLGPCDIKVLDKITGKEPMARKFVRDKWPSELALA